MNVHKSFLLGTSLLFLTGCTPSGQTTSDDLGTPTTATMSTEEQAYYDTCLTNFDCEGSHVVRSGDPAEVVGTLVITTDEKGEQLLEEAVRTIERFYANRDATMAEFFPADYPEDLLSARTFGVGHVLGYDDQYLYLSMNFSTYYKTAEGEIVQHGGSANIPFRFEYTEDLGGTFGMLDFKEAGEGMEGFDFIFPLEVQTIYNGIQGMNWQTSEQTAALKARAEEVLL